MGDDERTVTVQSLDDLIERCATRLDAGLQERPLVQFITGESGGDPIVLGEIKIDDSERAWIAAPHASRWARLKQAARYEA